MIDKLTEKLDAEDCNKPRFRCWQVVKANGDAPDTAVFDEVYVPANASLISTSLQRICSGLEFDQGRQETIEGVGYKVISGEQLRRLMEAASGQGGGMGSGIGARSGRSGTASTGEGDVRGGKQALLTGFRAAQREEAYKASLEFQLAISPQGWMLDTLRELAAKINFRTTVSVITEEEAKAREEQPAAALGIVEAPSITVVVRPERAEMNEEKKTFRLDMHIARVEVRGVNQEKLQSKAPDVGFAERDGALVLEGEDVSRQIYSIAAALNRDISPRGRTTGHTRRDGGLSM